MTFHASWQSNAFSLVHAPDGNRTDPSEIFSKSGKIDGREWQFERNRTIEYAEPTQAQKQRTIALGGVSGDEYLILEVINMGIEGLTPQTVKWNGNRFSTKLRGVYKCTGELQGIVNGRPSVLVYSDKDRALKGRVEYIYRNPSLPDHIPSTLTVSMAYGGQEFRALKEYRILNVSFEDALLPNEHFKPSEASSSSHLLYSNEAYFIKHSPTQWIQVNDSEPRPEGDEKKASATNNKKVVIYFLFLLSGAILLIFLLKKH